jgi:hypothetical protein
MERIFGKSVLFQRYFQFEYNKLTSLQKVLDYAAFDVFYLRHLHFALTMNMSNQNLRRIYGASSHFIRMVRDTEIVDNLLEYGSPLWAMVPSSLFNK